MTASRLIVGLLLLPLTLEAKELSCVAKSPARDYVNDVRKVIVNPETRKVSIIWHASDKPVVPVALLSSENQRSFTFNEPSGSDGQLNVFRLFYVGEWILIDAGLKVVNGTPTLFALGPSRTFICSSKNN